MKAFEVNSLYRCVQLCFIQFMNRSMSVCSKKEFVYYWKWHMANSVDKFIGKQETQEENDMFTQTMGDHLCKYLHIQNKSHIFRLFSLSFAPEIQTTCKQQQNTSNCKAYFLAMAASVDPRMTKQIFDARGRSRIGISNSSISFHSAFSTMPREVATTEHWGSLP